MEIWDRKTGAEGRRESSTDDFMPIRSENPSYPASSRGKIAVKNLSRACGSIEKEKLPWACWLEFYGNALCVLRHWKSWIVPRHSRT